MNVSVRNKKKPKVEKESKISLNVIIIQTSSNFILMGIQRRYFSLLWTKKYVLKWMSSLSYVYNFLLSKLHQISC